MRHFPKRDIVHMYVFALLNAWTLVKRIEYVLSDKVCSMKIMTNNDNVESSLLTSIY